MAILLIRPLGPQYYKTAGPDLGLGFLLTALARTGLSATVVDLVREPERRLRQVLRGQRFSHIGFKLYSKDIRHFRELVALIRAETRGPMPRLVAGGPLPTGLGEEFLCQFPEVDYAFRGEAEAGYPMLARALEEERAPDVEAIPGLIWRSNGTVRSAPQHFPPDLDALGYPDLSAMPPAAYPPDYTSGDVYVPIVTTRGCPYHCSYCGGPVANGHKLRKHSPGYVLDLIEDLYRRHGVTMISIVDDNFTMDPSHARAVLEGLVERRLPVRWRAPNGVRLDTLDRDLVRLMERSGCRELYLGIESGSPKVLADMKRRVSVETYREKVRLLAENTRIRLLGFFILGYPTEAEEDARRTIDLALELPLHRAAFFFFTPHPGTEIFEEMRARGEFPDDLWHSFFYDRPTLGTRSLSLARLRRLQRRAVLRFYLRPRIVRDLAASVRSPRQFGRLARKIAGTLLGR